MHCAISETSPPRDGVSAAVHGPNGVVLKIPVTGSPPEAGSMQRLTLLDQSWFWPADKVTSVVHIPALISAELLQAASRSAAAASACRMSNLPVSSSQDWRIADAAIELPGTQKQPQRQSKL
jgi:hypothetical protein